MSFTKFKGTSKYIANPSLCQTVNVAVALQKPLLIRGEPGTGKTILAQAIAEGLGCELLKWHIRSTTKAQEGLYHYDTVQRLNDSRFGDGEVSDISRYIKMGPLGQSFQSKNRNVLLIDEIDKADLEFPNDLLNELDTMSFVVRETEKQVSAIHRPVVVITSNNEKELPDAFLRRCVFHYIEFPETELMQEIVKVHFPDIEDKVLHRCIEKFYAIRSMDQIRKRPSTSELIDWIGALAASGTEIERLKSEIPFLGVLLKREQDLATFRPKSW